MRVLSAALSWIDRHVAVIVVAALLALSFLGWKTYTLGTRLSSTTRASVQQRVKTVEQRCDLTNKITDVLRKDDPPRVPAFEKSAHGCERQLVKVKQIAAHAP